MATFVHRNRNENSEPARQQISHDTIEASKRKPLVTISKHLAAKDRYVTLTFERHQYETPLFNLPRRSFQGSGEIQKKGEVS